MIPQTLISNEADRLAVLRKYAILDTLPETAFDDLTALAARICGTPYASISLIDENRQWFKSKVGLEATETSRMEAFCDHAVRSTELMIVPDAKDDPRFAKNPSVTGGIGIRFYAGAPLVTTEGAALGTLCVIDRVPRHMTALQEQVLRVLAQQVMTHLELRRRMLELLQSEEQLQIVTQKARVGLIVLDRERRYSYANGTYAEMLGLDSKDLVGKRVAEVLPDLYEDQIRPRADRAFAGHRVDYELTKHGPTGDQIFDVRYEPIRNNGEVTMAIVVLTDVTERKQRERAARHLASIVEFSKDAIIGRELDGVVTSWNKGAEALFGYTAEEVVGHHIPILTPPDREKEEDTLLAQVKSGEALSSFETVRKTKSGNLVDVAVTASPIRDQKTRIIGISQIIRDITQNRRDQNQLRLLETCVAHLSDIVIITDAEPIDEPGPRIVFVNETFVKRTGYSREEVMATSPRFLQGPKTQRDALDRIRAALQKREKVQVEVINYTKGGEEFWLEIQIVPLLDSLGVVTHFVAVERDITERKKAEELLRASEERYRLMFLSSPLPMFVYDSTTFRFLSVNSAAVETYGYSEEEFLRMTLRDIRPSGELAKFDAAVGLLRPKVKTSGIWKHRKKNGSVIDVEVCSDSIDYDGHSARLALANDVTDRLLAERGLRKSEESLANAQRIAKMGNWDLDLMTRKLYWSDQVYEIFGISKQDFEATYEAFIALVHPEDRERMNLANRLALAGSGMDMEHRIVRRDGTVRTVQEIGDLQLNDQGSPARLTGTVHDITERKEKEELALHLSHRMHSLMESTSEGIFGIDLDGKCTFINRAAAKMLEYDAQNVIGQNVHKLIHHHWRDGSPLEPEQCRILQTLSTGQKYQDDTDVFWRSDGKHFDVGYSASPLMEGARVTGAVVAFSDITEKKQAADQISEQAALLEKAQDSILVRDLTGKILFWNKGSERIYGWSRHEVLGKNVGDVIYPDRSKLEELTNIALLNGEWSGEVRHITKDRRDLVVEARLTIVCDKEGHPKSVLAINTDITEKKKMEAQFLRAQRMDSVGTLAGGVAHDLNNILAPILMSIELLKSTVSHPQGSSILKTIEISAKRGADIVSQVLSFARGVEGNRAVLDVRKVVEDIETIIRDTFPKNIERQIILPTYPCTILGDSTQVHQIILNLSVNARDSMPEGGTLTLAVENCEIDSAYAAMQIDAAPGRYVRITVKDTGSGISSETLNNIFEPFFTTKELGKGTGLGLSTVMTIVKSHKGFVNVYSELGKGSVFRVCLPAIAEVGKIDKADDQDNLPRGRGETILVIDDENAIRIVTCQTLQAFGYETLEAEEGAKALALFAENRGKIAAVLTDMAMPILDGPATIRALQSMDPNVKIMAASGLKSSGVATKASQGGVRYFLPKPFTAALMLKTLRKMIDEE